MTPAALALPCAAVLVDLDGTLVDTAPDIVAAANRMLAGLGSPPLPFDTVAGFIGRGVPNLVRRVLATARLAPQVEAAEAETLFHHHYAGLNGQLGAVFPGVEAGLAALRRDGYRLACVTNKPRALAAPLLTLTGLAPYLDVLVAGDALARMKPDPEPLRHACRLLGVDPALGVLVGDSPVDVAAARAAGIAVCVVRYGYAGPGGAAALGADALVDSMEAVPGLLTPARRSTPDRHSPAS